MTWVRDGLLFFALVLALLGLDADVGMGRLWWSLLLGLLAIVLTMLHPGARPLRWRDLLGIALVASPVGLRLLVLVLLPLAAHALASM